MSDIQLRTIQPGDISKLRVLFEQTYVYEPVSDSLMREKIFDESLTLVAANAGQITGFIMGVTRPDYKPEKGWIKLLAVHPKFQGQGIGKLLVGRVEDLFRQRNMKTVSLFDTPYNYYTPGLDPRYTRELVFFQDQGYERTGDAVNMLCSLNQDFSTHADEKRLKSEGVTIRT